MVHHRQGLPLGLEAGDHLPRVHARLDDLERDGPLDRLGLLGHEDDAHAAFADLLQQLVGADDRAGTFGDASGRWSIGRIRMRAPQENCPASIVRCQKSIRPALARSAISAAGFVKIRRALDRVGVSDAACERSSSLMLMAAHSMHAATLAA